MFGQFRHILAICVVSFATSVGCTTLEPGSLAWVKHQQRMGAYRAVQECIDGYAARVWPNQIVYPDARSHPCVQCMVGRDTGACAVLGKRPEA